MAYTYVKPGLASFDVDKPVIHKPTDAIAYHKKPLFMEQTSILSRDIPACQNGTILDHEELGLLKKLGKVSNFKGK